MLFWFKDLLFGGMFFWTCRMQADVDRLRREVDALLRRAGGGRT